MRTRKQLAVHDALRRIGLGLALAGIDPRATSTAVRHVPRFVRDLRTFRTMSRSAGTPLPSWRTALPALADASSGAGTTGEYFLADLWTARRIREQAPSRHLDVGSRIDGLVAHLLTFTSVDVVDLRPLTTEIDGLRFIQADACRLDGITTVSASSIHALEHFGLGRYGDPLDPLGHLRGLDALAGTVLPGGHLYVGYPVGRPRVEFNGHRIIDPMLAVERLAGFELVEFAAVVDGAVRPTDPGAVAHLPYAVGLYHFVRA